MAEILQMNNYDYVVFVDSDMGVINPNRSIEEFLIDDKHLIFYNRIFNIEVAAGGYIAKFLSLLSCIVLVSMPKFET